MEEKRKGILMVDDTKPIRVLVLKTFEKKYKIFLEEKGIEALRTLRDYEDEINLIILDFEMPKLNGYQLLKMIRNVNDKIPVIMMSASLNEERVRKIRKLNVDEFLAKPVNVNRLKEVIRKYLENNDQEI